MYKIQGVFATAGVRNRNGRIYPVELWKKNVDKFNEFIKHNTIECLMEWEHPEDRLSIDPQRAVAKLTKLELRGNVVYGEAEILDVPLADAVKAMIDKSIKIGVSSRGNGDVDYTGNVTNFELYAFDLVAYPSDLNATTTGLKERASDLHGILVERSSDIVITSLDNSVARDLTGNELSAKLTELVDNVLRLGYPDYVSDEEVLQNAVDDLNLRQDKLQFEVMSLFDEVISMCDLLANNIIKEKE